MHQTQALPQGDWEKWLPPVPHRGPIVDFLLRARAELVLRENDQPPLVRFEDGGVMELDAIRWDARVGNFVHAQDPTRRTRAEYRATQYSDVCGSLDELKRVLAAEPDRVATGREYLETLLDDALYMIGRMNRRQREYHEFGRVLLDLAQRMLAVPEQCIEPAIEGVAELRRRFDADPGCARSDLDRLNELAEQIRDVASNQEERLREHKELAIEAYHLYARIRGKRNWAEDEAPPE